MTRRSYSGQANPNWRGGHRGGGEKSQYVMAYAPNHPNAIEGAVLEHRLIVEADLGRSLRRDEVIHHVNGDKRDNRLANLRVMSQSDHARLHDSLAGRRYVRPPVRIHLTCERCGDPFTATKTRDQSRRFCSRSCYWAYRRTTHHALAKGEPA